MGINLSSPWRVVKTELKLSEASNVREPHIWIDYERGARFL